MLSRPQMEERVRWEAGSYKMQRKALRVQSQEPCILILALPPIV